MQNFRRKILFTILAFLTVVFIGMYLFVYTHYTVPILTYHSVNNEYRGMPTVSIKSFNAQIEYLYKHKYNVISFNELIDAINAKKRLPRNTVVITFDDGFEDNYANAFLILKKYKMPVIIFLISDFIGKKPEHLNWQEVREMLKDNIDFGSHTQTHLYLPEANKENIYKELKASKEQIEANIKQKVLFISYPAGGFNEDIKKIVKQLGFKAACTTNRGFDKANLDVFELKRIKVTDKDAKNLIYFKLKLSGYYNIFRKAKDPC